MQHFSARIVFRRGKGEVEGDNARFVLFQFIDEVGVGAARQRESPDVLEGFFIHSDNHDAGIWRARSTKGKAQIERALFDVLQEYESGPLIAADAGKSKQYQAERGHQESDGSIGVAQREVDELSPKFAASAQVKRLTGRTSPLGWLRRLPAAEWRWEDGMYWCAKRPRRRRCPLLQPRSPTTIPESAAGAQPRVRFRRG